MEKRICVLLLLWLLAACSPGIYPVSQEKLLRDDVWFLASDALGGRKAGEKGDSVAAGFIRDRFREAGLKLLYDNGYQSFDLISSVEPGDSNDLRINSEMLQLHQDFLPYSFSSGEAFSGQVVFAGYGFDIQLDTLKWNDYANLDVSGKWVIILKGDPEIDKSESVFEPYSAERSKVLTAVDHHASGVLFVSGPASGAEDRLGGMFYDKNSSTYPVPVFQITRKVADQLVASANSTIAGLEQKLNAGRQPVSFVTGIRVEGRADVKPQKVTSHNVAALLPGRDPQLKNEYVVIGAHYDHLGSGGPGSGSRLPDTVAVHYGADDNASGVAMVIDLARKLSKEGKNRRSLIFTAFGAEEMGTIGSGAFVENPPADLKKMVAMFNFDMVGRLDSSANALSIGGSLTSKESETILSRLNPGFNLAFSGEGIGPSDHALFYLQDIPVFFFSTGAHSDYHTPGDTPDKVNYNGIRKISDYAGLVISEVANRDSSLTFQEAGSKTKRSRGGRFSVTLGVMPDYAGLDKRGMRVDAVTKDKPAYRAGMLKGDVITSIDGKPVGNIYDYMNRLKTLKEGQTISVDIIRNGQPVVLIVQL